MTEKERQEHLKVLVDLLPDLPGVYQYFNEKNQIIYIGKAKSLKKRVSSYFNNKRHNLKTSTLVSKIYDIKHIVVETEKDAFLLENNLIKKFKPRYNILLKDDKTYPWIKIINEPFPRVVLTRNVVKDGSKYYGPYTSGQEIKFLFAVINKNYRIRTCSLSLGEAERSRGRYRECLKYHIKKCDAPCTNRITYEEYNQKIDEIRALLKGNFTSLIKKLKQAMMNAAEKLEFEKAELFRQRLEALDKYQEHSVISSNQKINVDALGFANEKNKTFVNYLKVIEGKITESFTMTFEHMLEEEEGEILLRALSEIKNLDKNLQQEILVRNIPDEEFDDVHYTTPKIGDKLKILELSEKNAQLYKFEYVRKEAVKNKSVSRSDKLLINIKEKIGLRDIPRHIEIFDNSNIQGQNAVAACVVFKDAKPSKSDYRKFNIKTVDGADDYASMYEVAHRRYSRLIEEKSELPNLIVADGGEGQMMVLFRVIKELGLDIDIIGLAKDDKHRTNEILFGEQAKRIDIRKQNDIFKFFTRMQDEVHRFAIEFHRSKRSREMIHSELDNISGIGEKTKEKLLKDFKSIEAISKASIENLSESIGRNKAEIIQKYFRND